MGANALLKKAENFKTVKNKRKVYRIMQIFRTIIKEDGIANLANIEYTLFYILNKAVQLNPGLKYILLDRIIQSNKTY